MRISDWSSDVCSSDLWHLEVGRAVIFRRRQMSTAHVHLDGGQDQARHLQRCIALRAHLDELTLIHIFVKMHIGCALCEHGGFPHEFGAIGRFVIMARSEEHTSELQSLMRISYAVFCLKKKKTK